MRASFVWFAIVTCGFAAETGATDPKPLWTGPGVNLLGGPSRDGKILSYVDPATRNLAIREFSTGQTRTLTHQQGGEFAVLLLHLSRLPQSRLRVVQLGRVL